MCIAQHFVAGEGETHPFETDTLSTDTVNLPWVILRAVHQASRLDGIPARARAVLAALARTVDAKKPYGEIYARRTLLSERAMQSERTFYRSLTDLETAGLIDRRPQRRYVDHGLFGRAYLHLTERAAVLLGLVEEAAPDAAEAPAEGFVQPSDSVADGANTKDLIPTAFQKRQPGRVVEKDSNQTETHQANPTRAKQANQLPADLQRLRALGFGDFLIFRLMREAREAGKRLSEVVEVCWASLRKATRPINYLRALLASPTDFGHQLRTRLAEQQAAKDAAEERQRAAAAVRGLDGQTFVDASGETQYAVGQGGAVLTVYRRDEGTARQAAGDWATGFVRALEKGQIARVTETERVLSRITCSERVKVPVSFGTPAPRVLTTQISEHLTQLRQLCRRVA
ncbi:hypothetical protein AB4Y32_28935 [Paraburkholderia phymatum]|uniref:Uncharacterized protein n=1 Tax=Paraburkholderia phymatum TaxID=148447 RepID=A0ACC6U825_9BURK